MQRVADRLCRRVQDISLCLKQRLTCYDDVRTRDLGNSVRHTQWAYKRFCASYRAGE